MLIGVATLTHDQPDQPAVVSPKMDEEVDPDEPLVIQWKTVKDPDPPTSVIEAYQVIVEKNEIEERLRVFTADMLSTDTTLTVAPGFLEPGKAYKVEVLAIETSGNQTITEVEFAQQLESNICRCQLPKKRGSSTCFAPGLPFSSTT